ncbi:uncharacterized protein [Amphiura filiformis]|uniref:uncharacterized protein n=1 Tax=Amphiura filiformis TaxID=82378 RepID=UPI003B221121
MEWIGELEERRKEQRHRVKVFKKERKHDDDKEHTELGELNLDYHRDTHGLILGSGERSEESNPVAEDESRLQHRERLKAWHIEEHQKRMVEKDPDQSLSHNDSAMDCLTTEITEGDIISRCTLYGVPIPAAPPISREFYTKLGLRIPRELDVVEEGHEDDLDSCSSLEDIVTVGSLVDSDVDWHEKLNDRPVLCVGNLFEKSNVEMHKHGHISRARPIASDTALDKLLEFEDTNLSIYDNHHLFVGVDKETLHHTNSIPDILNGEAAFLEDDYEASQVTHRTSFVAMDVANENTQLQAHIINGHALLVTKKQLELEKELIKFREEHHDLDFTTCKHIGIQHRYYNQRRKNIQIGKMKSFK